jgi:hypothetical protein
MTKYYNLSNYDERHIAKAKEYLKAAFWGHMTVCLDEKIDDFIEKMQKHEFQGNDTFTLNFSLETVGNDVLTAIGCAINNEERVR